MYHFRFIIPTIRMRIIHIPFVLFGFIGYIVCEECGNGDGSLEMMLHKRLLCNYDRDNRPVKNYKTPVNVTIKISLNVLRYSWQWAGVESMETNSWVYLSWFDEYLKWDPNDYEGMHETIISSTKIWIPDLSLYNSMKSQLVLFVLVGFISYIACEECGNGDGSLEVMLHKRILCNYDKDNRPVKNHKSPVNVTIRLVLKYITYSSQWSTIEELRVNSWVYLSWYDEYLIWDPKDYEGMDETVISSTKIWVPDLSLYNSPEGQAMRFNYPCTVDFDGEVSCIPQITHTVTCRLDYKSWPYDRQTCTLNFGTWAHKGEEVNYILAKDPISTEDYVENKYWKLISVNVSKDSGHFTCCPNVTYPTLRYQFKIERFTALLVEQFFTPALAMISMTIISLCLNIVSVEKVFVMIFNVGCHFFYLYNLDGKIPANGNTKPDILIYFRDTAILSCIVLFHGVILKNIVKYTTEVPAWINRLTIVMNTAPGKIVFHEFDPTSNAAPDDVENLAENVVDKNGEWKKIALFFNRSFLVIVLLTYIILILKYLL